MAFNLNADVIKKIDGARVRLLKCGGEEEVNRVFSDFNITEPKVKTMLLRRSMKMRETRDIMADDAAAYRHYLEIFVEGKWREDNFIEKYENCESKIIENTDNIQSGQDKDSVCREFGVKEETYDHLYQFYKNEILPNIEKKHLAYMISIVEDIINANVKRRNPTSVFYPFKIFISEKAPPGRNASTVLFPDAAIIFYNPNIKDDNNDEPNSASRILIAHELGQLLISQKIISGENTENLANLFAFIVTNQRNEYYINKKTKKYDDYKKIIKSIKKICSAQTPKTTN